MEELRNIYKNNDEIRHTVITNLIKLFQRRKYIDDGMDKVDTIIKSIKDNNIANLKFKDINVSIYYLNEDVKNISSGSNLDDFMSKSLDTKKIIIISSFSKKVFNQVSEYKNSEIFRIYELLEDIPSKVFIPKHQLMLPEDEAELLKVYEKSKLPHIYHTDMMARYYGAEIGNIMRIRRKNLNSGHSSYYRVVVNDKTLSMFDK